MLPSVREMEAYIRQAAIARGIDPDVAVRVARSEGLGEGIWQSNIMQDYGREQSYGPFQLHVAPEGRTPGLGNAFIEKTGLDPADPSTWKQGVNFALDTAASGGWSPWMGAQKIGVTGKAGIGEAPVRDDRGGVYNSGYGTAAPGLLDNPTAVAGSNDKWMKLADASIKLMDDSEEDMAPTAAPAVVLQPLRRVTLKGLL